jgi:hypothetical protein
MILLFVLYAHLLMIYMLANCPLRQDDNRPRFLARQLELFIFNKRVLDPNNTIVNQSLANIGLIGKAV